MIRVLHIVTQMNRNGLESRLMDLYRKIDKSKVQFDFLKHRHGVGDFELEIKSMGGKVYHIPTRTVRSVLDGSYMKALGVFFSLHEYKIVHSHLNSLSRFPLKAAKKASVPVRIAHSRNAGVESGPKGWMKQIARLDLNRYPTDFFACSDKAGRWLFGKRIYEKGAIKYVHNAIDCTTFRYDSKVRRDMRKELDLEDQMVVGHVGRFHEQKNHLYLLHIFEAMLARNNDCHLILIGTGNRFKEIKEKVDKSSYKNKVTFLGKREDVHRLMQAMDIFLLPSLYEGLPGVGVEAQAAGLPIIMSDRVSREAGITNNVRFLSIDLPPDKWASEAFDVLERYSRTDTYEVMVEKGYEVTAVANDLQRFYLEKGTDY